MRNISCLFFIYILYRSLGISRNIDTSCIYIIFKLEVKYDSHMSIIFRALVLKMIDELHFGGEIKARYDVYETKCLLFKKQLSPVNVIMK